MACAEGLSVTGESQTASAVLLVEPAAFGFNPETAASNVFAGSGEAREARREFDALARRLDDADVEVLMLPDTPQPARPDAVFPNNWFSTHADGTLVLYPMAAPSRRLERRVDDLAALLRSRGFAVERRIDLSPHERAGEFLEGTGSLVLDRPGRRAFASLGPRTHERALAAFAGALGYETFAFAAGDPDGRSLYHTNVMMSLGARYALACLDCVPDPQRAELRRRLEEGDRTLIEVEWDQARRFACNLLELEARSGERFIALSTSAKESLRPDQRTDLERLAGPLVDVPIPTIEAVGGGSVRCMIAEIHLPRPGSLS